jgi:hypothetical protein
MKRILKKCYLVVYLLLMLVFISLQGLNLPGQRSLIEYILLCAWIAVTVGFTLHVIWNRKGKVSKNPNIVFLPIFHATLHLMIFIPTDYFYDWTHSMSHGMARSIVWLYLISSFFSSPILSAGILSECFERKHRSDSSEAYVVFCVLLEILLFIWTIRFGLVNLTYISGV